MPKIHQLSTQEIQKIAAGEVVDRPANVVKELIENSIDAQASHIKIFVQDGGKELIRVIDNGCGMDAADARRCFDHHATSKISTIEDLDTIGTFGFRGEALSSIAAVSRITLVTKEPNSEFGIQLKLQDGIITDESYIAANSGTDMSIADIFYSIPARKKFLKARETEWRHISLLVRAYCMAYRTIHFELFSDNQQILNCTPINDLRERAIQVWQYHVGSTMVPIMLEDTHKNVSITGLISNHQYSQYDRSNIYVFINNRWIKNNHLIKALLKGYANVLQPGKFPAAVLSISVKQSDIDVNVHPRKEEIKFLHPQTVDNLITTAAKKALESNISSKIKARQEPEFDASDMLATPSPTDFSKFWQPPMANHKIFVPKEHSQKQTVQLLEQTAIELRSEPPLSEIPVNLPVQVPTEQLPQKEKPYNLSIIKEDKKTAQEPIVLGQLNKTYILLEHARGLMIIDQHAAHERILYEQFSKKFDHIATVKLLFPVIITLPAHDISALELYRELLIMHGIHIEPFGQQQIIITSTPVTMQHIDLEDLIKQFTAIIHNQDQLNSQELREKLTGHLRALMACKAAVKAGDMLTLQQMKTIVDDLAKTDNNLTCPHGRPTSWIINTNEIEKKFKRDYKGAARQEFL